MDSENPQENANLDPTPEQVKHFWAFTRDHVGWTTLEGIFGQQQVSSIEPPWMHLAETPREADALVQQLIEDGKVAIKTEIHEGEPLPQRGDLVIIVGSQGRPTALAATLRVDEKPLSTDASPEDSAGEASSPREHDRQPGQLVRIVKETLRCLYPQPDAKKRETDRKGKA